MSTPKLPLVPGLVSSSPVRDSRYVCPLMLRTTDWAPARQVPGPRPQTLGFKNGYALTEQVSVTGVSADPDPTSAPAAPTRVDHLTASPASKQPGWLANDKKVLRYFGYFDEPVPEGFVAPSLTGPAAKEPYRVRKCVLCACTCCMLALRAACLHCELRARTACSALSGCGLCCLFDQARPLS